MRTLFFSLTIALFAVAGCNKCYECNMGTKQNPDIREYCKKDYPGDKSMFEKTIEEYQKAGYVCTRK